MQRTGSMRSATALPLPTRKCINRAKMPRLLIAFMRDDKEYGIFLNRQVACWLDRISSGLLHLTLYKMSKDYHKLAKDGILPNSYPLPTLRTGEVVSFGQAQQTYEWKDPQKVRCPQAKPILPGKFLVGNGSMSLCHSFA